MRNNHRKQWTRETFSGPSGGPFRRHINPIQFAVNPLGVCNLYGYKARDFSGKRSDPTRYARAIYILDKAQSSRGSQAVHAQRRSEAP